MKRTLPVAVFAATICCCASCRDATEPSADRSASVASIEPSGPIESPAGSTTAGEDELRQHVRVERERRGSYRRPSSAETERTIQLFAETLSNDADLSRLGSEWESDGIDLRAVDAGGESFWILKERPGEQFGRGIVAIRRSPSVSVMLQAPHSFYDRDTDEIALELFVRTRALACYWNTVHRRVADLTKEDDSFLNALSEGFARTHLNGRIAQFHGFSQTSMTGRFGRHVDLIVSQGTETPDQAFLKLAQAVRRACEPFETTVFPLDSHRLGGTQNRQRQILAARGFRDFVHCEMGPEFRSAIMDDVELLTRLGGALTHLELNPQID